MGLPVDFEPIRTPFRYYKNGTNCHERILGRCTCKRNKGSKGCWGRLGFGVRSCDTQLIVLAGRACHGQRRSEARIGEALEVGVAEV
jgi:hypothetical protein